jgi:DNA helicase-2/ATP-dependent DNA helicase PcrA
LTLAHLDEDQKRAVTCDPAVALIIVAGPGSGKTRVIVERVKYLTSHYDTKPPEVLCLTFSDKAAEEMRTRIEKELKTSEVETTTFHSFCLGVLDESVFDTGVSYKGGLISRSNQLVWGLKSIDNFGFENIAIGNNAVEVIESIIDGISAFRDELVTPQELREYTVQRKKELFALREKLAGSQEKPSTPGKKKSRKTKPSDGEPSLQDVDDERAFVNQLADLQKVYEKYELFKRKESLIDYDDMLQIVVQLFRDKPHVLKRYQDRYAHVLVDEFQDNNFAQLELVKLLCPDGHVTVVGDDDQSIYRFRGAYDTIFSDFTKHYGDNARTEKLERNYRSSKRIVGLAKQLLDPVPNRVRKNLYSENEEGGLVAVARCATDLAEVDYVVSKIKGDLIGKELKRRDGNAAPITYRDIAILSRRRLEGMKFARAIRAQGLPCTFLGETKIFAMPVIRDLMAYLRVADDPLANGIELARIMLLHGVSEQDLKIINHAATVKTRNLNKRVEVMIQGTTSRNEDNDANRNYGTDFVYAVMQELATSPGALQISQDIGNANLIKEVYQQIKGIVDSRNKKTLYEFVYDVVMSHTDIYRRTLRQDGNSVTESDGKSRIALNEFLRLVQEFDGIAKKATLKELLGHLDMMSDFDIELKQDEGKMDAIVVTTIHQSKGREFPVVFVVDVADRRLPVSFREKKFYCPSALAHSIRSREFSEKELFIQEERRLLYVAMTRAQHQLYLTRAEIYGDNTTKTKPSQFLMELDPETNPLVESVEHSVQQDAPMISASDSRIDQLKHEYQNLITKFIEQMQLGSAIEKLVELAIVAHYQAGKPLAEFRLEEVFPQSFFDNTAIETRRKSVEMQLREEQVSLINADKMHFSASALKAYQDCPLKYKFSYVLEVPTPSKAYFDLGNTVHSVVEVLTKRQIDEKDYLPSFQDTVTLLDKYWVSNSYQSLTQEQEDRKAAENMLRYFVSWCSERKDLGCTPVAAEKEFEIAVVNGRKLKGFIDRIDLDSSGNYELFDYKTGKSMLNGNSIRKNIQMNGYSLAVREIYGKLPSTANLLYLRNEQPLVYRVTNEGVANAEQELTAILNNILGENFSPTPGAFTCKFCDYQSICEAKEIEDDS